MQYILFSVFQDDSTKLPDTESKARTNNYARNLASSVPEPKTRVTSSKRRTSRSNSQAKSTYPGISGQSYESRLASGTPLPQASGKSLVIA